MAFRIGGLSGNPDGLFDRDRSLAGDMVEKAHALHDRGPARCGIRPQGILELGSEIVAT